MLLSAFDMYRMLSLAASETYLLCGPVGFSSLSRVFHRSAAPIQALHT